MKKIPVYYSEDFVVDYNTVDCENPHRIIEIWLKIKEIADFIEPAPCTVSDLRLCHTQRLIESVERDSQLYPVAARAAGGAVMAAERALSATPSFALIRPPGHHAGRAFNGGFCFFNNMAIAVRKLLADDVIRSALIVDIDLHYGNGTFDIVKDDERIAFRNIDAATRVEFFEAMDDALEDASTFDVVGCSAGFDTYVRDWGSLLFTEDFRRIGSLFVAANPHFFSILEGGYYIDDLGLNVHAFLTGMQEACS
jgi:acetoin utilization deacetylase AcuC-like enzyme